MVVYNEAFIYTSLEKSFKFLKIHHFISTIIQASIMIDIIIISICYNIHYSSKLSNIIII